MKQKRKSIALLLLLLFSGSVFLSSSEDAEANFEGFLPQCLTDAESGEDSGGTSDDDKEEGSEDPGGTGGNWQEEGTGAYKNAKDVWDFWKEKGFSGAAIAGILGNVAHEGDFDIPDRAEGHYGSNSKENGISEGNVPETGPGYPKGESGKVEGGGGHYQFTPYSKFADVGDEKWKSGAKQSEYVWTSEVQDASWLDSYIKIDNPEEATEQWFSKYERGAQLAPEKAESAKKAYKVFGGSDVSADSALASADDTAEEEEDEQKEKSEDPCEPSQEEGKSNDSGGGGKGIMKYTAKLKGYFSYEQTHGEKLIGSVDKPDKNGLTDCSGYIWLVLKQAGYNVPDDMQWYTQSMEDDAKGDNEYLKEVDKKDAKAGDVVIVNTGDGAGSNGHTAFLLEDWKDDDVEGNQTKISQMGGDPEADGVNEREFDYGFGSLVRQSHTIVFARPQK